MPKLQPIDYYTQLKDGGYLVIPATVLVELRKHRQLRANDCEAGGVLIGYWRSEKATKGYRCRHAEITDVTRPVKGDSRSRFGFTRRAKHHVDRIKAAWNTSDKKQTYLGEWHTHPQRHPTPSSIDVAEWQKNFGTDTKIVIIVGIETVWVGLWDAGCLTHCDALRADS